MTSNKQHKSISEQTFRVENGWEDIDTDDYQSTVATLEGGARSEMGLGQSQIRDEVRVWRGAGNAGEKNYSQGMNPTKCLMGPHILFK